MPCYCQSIVPSGTACLSKAKGHRLDTLTRGRCECFIGSIRAHASCLSETMAGAASYIPSSVGARIHKSTLMRQLRASRPGEHPACAGKHIHFQSDAA